MPWGHLSGLWLAGGHPPDPRTTSARHKEAARLTKGAYMRRRALGQPVREAAVHRLGARERVELHRIGVNLNQIARALNSGASAPAGTLEAVERRDVERAARETKERERGRSITRIPPRPPRPRAWRGRVRAMTLDVGIAM